MDAETILSIWKRFVYVMIGVLCFLILSPFLSPVVDFVEYKRGGYRTSEAKDDAMQVRQAIETYFTEYQRFPVADSAIESPSHPFYSDHDLMDVLLGSNKSALPDGLNPRRISFYGGRKAKGNLPKSGVVYQAGGGGELFDPWGNHYRALIDLNGDSQLATPPWSTQRKRPSSEWIPTGIISPPSGVIVWSPGPDGNDETEDDNITTW